MALKSLKSLTQKPAASSEPEPSGKKTLASSTRSLKPLGKKPEPVVEAEATVVEEEPVAAPAPKGLRPLKPLKPAAKVEPEPEPEPEDDQTGDELTSLDRAGLKQLIADEELEVAVNKSMSDDDIRAAIRAVRPAAGVIETAEKEAPIEEEEAAPAPTPKTGLKKLGAAPKAAAPAPETVEDEDTERAIVPIQPASYSLGAITGEIDDADVMRPRIEFVQNVGPLVEECDPPYTPGQVVLAKEVLLWEKGAPGPLELIILAAHKRFVEVTEYGSDVMPRIFQTREEVKAAGLWTEWQDNEAPPVKPELICLVLLKQPDFVEPHDIFSEEIDGERWTMAEVRLSGTSYKDPKAGRYVMTVAKSTLAKGLHHGVMHLTAVREKKGKNIITVPVFKYSRASSPEELKAIARLMGAEE